MFLLQLVIIECALDELSNKLRSEEQFWFDELIF